MARLLFIIMTNISIGAIAKKKLTCLVYENKMPNVGRTRSKDAFKTTEVLTTIALLNDRCD